MSTSVLFARGLLAEVARRGVDASHVLQQCDLDGERIASMRQTLSFHELDRLVAEAMSATSEPGLGLSLGAHAPVGMLHLLGHLVLSQPTLRAVFQTLQRYASLLVQGPTATLVELGDTAYFQWDPRLPEGDCRRCVVEYTFAMAARIGELMLGPRAELLAVAFKHAAPDYVDRYTELFRCPLSFGQEADVMSLPRASLDIRQPYADETMGALLSEVADRLLADNGAVLSLTDSVRRLLHHEGELNVLSLESVAERLHLSPRCLRRKLGREGSTFSGIFDDTRRALACSELRRADASIKRVSLRLGFSEPSAFYRAFRRWTGVTPLQYMRRSRASMSRHGQGERMDPDAHTELRLLAE